MPRGRPSKRALRDNLKSGGAKIAEHFRRYPLRQPVDHQFEPYYHRILDADLAAALEYCDRHCALDDSFYELIGRLVPLQSWDAAKQIVSEIKRRGFYLNDSRRGSSERLPGEVIYRCEYDQLKSLCGVARKFIRKRYREDLYVRREELWDEYVDEFYSLYYFPFATLRSEQSPFKCSADLKAWGETIYPHIFRTPRRVNKVLWELIEQFSLHHLVPKPMFFELAESNRRPNAIAERDKRYRNRTFLFTPSLIARKWAAAMVGLSVSSVSHQNRRS